jgi:phage tail sheath protein FI
MALGAPSESPAVVVKEIDLTGGVPNVQSTTGAIVGNFRWGPVEQRTKIANETELADTFATPDETNTIDYHSASYFLRYSSNMQVVRAVTSAATNAFSTTKASLTTGGEVIDGDLNTGGTTLTLTNTKYSSDSQNTLRIAEASTNHQNQTVLIKNFDNWEEQASSLGDITQTQALGTDSDGSGNLLLDSDAGISGNITFAARYPGALGNSLAVSICARGADFDGWDYEDDFDGAPGTSAYVEGNPGTAANDEIHVVVVDDKGTITGTKGAVLETYPFLSKVKGATNADGTNNYALDVINQRSSYVHMAQWDSDQKTSGAGEVLTDTDNTDFSSAVSGVIDHTFSNGTNSAALGASEYSTGHDLFEDRDQVEVDFLIAPGLSGDAWKTTVNDLVATAEARKDCVVTSSPPRDKVVNITNTANIVTDTVAAANSLSKRSSYHVMDNNYLKVYDKFNDQYIHIPAASSTAGLMAKTDIERAPWFSPAGSRRGGYLGITSISYSPTKGQRDTLYKASVNPIANIPGQGTLLFGDKTMLTRASAFDRINVRRLFLVLERAIARAAEQVLFEFNDEFTRAEFVNIIEPVLREVKGRRGITDFRVVADETNNTPAVIDRNEFIANIFIKPARSINYVTLNFVAVRTGVDFEEVVGTV